MELHTPHDYHKFISIEFGSIIYHSIVVDYLFSHFFLYSVTIILISLLFFFPLVDVGVILLLSIFVCLFFFIPISTFCPCIQMLLLLVFNNSVQIKNKNIDICLIITKKILLSSNTLIMRAATETTLIRYCNIIILLSVVVIISWKNAAFFFSFY